MKPAGSSVDPTPMNETRLTEALVLESTAPWWLLLVAAGGLLWMAPGLLKILGRPPAWSRLPSAVFLVPGAFFVIFSFIFFWAHEPLRVEFNRPPGAITLRDGASRARLPLSDFHSLYVATRREGKRAEFRLYLRRTGGRFLFIEIFDSRAALLRFADPISTIAGLPIRGLDEYTPVQEDEEFGTPPHPEVVIAAHPVGRTYDSVPEARPPAEPDSGEFVAATDRLTIRSTHAGTLYYWESRQYWLVLPLLAWAGLLYLLFVVIPGLRGWSPVLILFQTICAGIFVVLLLGLPLALSGKQCLLLGESGLYAWQDVGGLRIRRGYLDYDSVTHLHHTMNEPADPFLTLVPGESRTAARFEGPVQLDPRGLSIAEQLRLENAILERLPARLRETPGEPDALSREIRRALSGS